MAPVSASAPSAVLRRRRPHHDLDGSGVPSSDGGGPGMELGQCFFVGHGDSLPRYCHLSIVNRQQTRAQSHLQAAQSSTIPTAKKQAAATA